MRTLLPTNPAHLAAGSALAGAIWGLWQGHAGSPSSPVDEAEARTRPDDEPAS